jgi:hypothetical protein
MSDVISSGALMDDVYRWGRGTGAANDAHGPYDVDPVARVAIKKIVGRAGCHHLHDELTRPRGGIRDRKKLSSIVAFRPDPESINVTISR